MYGDSALPDRAIRLLTISPSLDPNERLGCYCNTFQLEAAPPYEALSYTWGDPLPRIEIQCNDQPVAVGLELSHALMRLRLPNVPRVVWVDALCINQDDNDEKSLQVPLMGTIFSQATRVAVWLGQSDPQQVVETMQFLAFIANACRQYDLEHGLEPDVFRRDRQLKVALEKFTPSVCNALEALFNRPWFTRVWCVQEICLAQDAIVLWGEQELSWSDIGVAADWMIGRQFREYLENDKISSSYWSVRTQNAALMFDRDPKGTLLETLGVYHGWEATDPRDKVYGLLSMVTPESEVEALHVDYNKLVGQVYADTTLATIRTHSRLTALAYVAHPEEFNVDVEVASWAPDWEHETFYIQEMGVRESACPWAASGGKLVRHADEDYQKLQQQLCLSGILYDTVTSVSIVSPLPLREYTEEDFDEKSFTLEAFIEKTQNIHGEDFWQTLARTLTAGESGYLDYVLRTDYRSQDDHYLGFICMMRKLLPDATDRSFELATVPPEYDSGIFESNVRSYCRHRRLFCTQNGSFALGPACMRPGDIVVVLYGGNTPYVLRTRHDKYMFMGQAYVDAIMLGELVEEMEGGNRQEQEFCII